MSLTAGAAEADGEVNKLKRKLDAMQGENGELKGKLDAMQGENVQLKRNLDAIQTAFNAFEDTMKAAM